MPSSRAMARTWSYPRHHNYERALRKAAAGWFQSRGYATHPRYRYILADREQWHQNIILPEVADYIEDEKAKNESLRISYPLHKYIHHGLSSQAMLFNLLGPLVVQDDWDTLREIFARVDVSWPGDSLDVSFEYDNREVFNEDTGQPTSIDFVVGRKNEAPAIFLEAKLVEKEFGGCSVFAAGDCDGRNPVGDLSQCYLHYIGRRYWEIMDAQGFLEGPLATDTTCIMASYYQYFREVLMALELGGSFILLCDARSPTFFVKTEAGVRGLMPLLTAVTPATLHDRIKTLTIQEVVEVIKTSGKHAWIAEFEKKYGMR